MLDISRLVSFSLIPSLYYFYVYIYRQVESPEDFLTSLRAGTKTGYHHARHNAWNAPIPSIWGKRQSLLLWITSYGVDQHQHQHPHVSVRSHFPTMSAHHPHALQYLPRAHAKQGHRHILVHSYIRLVPSRVTAPWPAPLCTSLLLRCLMCGQRTHTFGAVGHTQMTRTL
ncbi:hypothetical protein BJV78DRAFT_116742 [Lactifluus subvellereus]|nr:hypothetical protein BJV78DRAFT_116742 [Lactifluus subvellereus]